MLIAYQFIFQSLKVVCRLNPDFTRNRQAQAKTTIRTQSIKFGCFLNYKVPESSLFTPSVTIVESSILARGLGFIKVNKARKKRFSLSTILTARVAKRLF